MVVLDFDGTIVESNNIKHDAFFDALEKMNWPKAKLLEGILETGPTLTRYDIADRLAYELGPSFDKPRFLDLYSRQCKNQVADAPFIPGASAFMHYLFGNNIPMVLSSATDESDLKFHVSEMGIAAYFELIMGSPRHKIDHMQAVFTYFGCETGDVLSIGDTHSDYNVALETNVAFVGIGNAFDSVLKTPISFKNFFTLSQYFIETRRSK